MKEPPIDSKNGKAASPARPAAQYEVPKQFQSYVGNVRLQDEIIETLRPRLVDYLTARGVELKKQGNRLVGLCPVHNDSKPSFAVFGDNHEMAACRCLFKTRQRRFKTRQRLNKTGFL